jgi:nucleotide-binding universal stress UspA family protein
MNARKICIAFDGSDNAQRAAAYVGEVVGAAPGFSVTLLSIERQPDPDHFPDESAWLARIKDDQARLRAALDAAHAGLVAAGLAPDAVKELVLSGCRLAFAGARSCLPGKSVAEDLLRAASEEGFGTIVIGRRGVSKAEEMLFGSVSTRIIRDAKGCAVWIVE